MSSQELVKKDNYPERFDPYMYLATRYRTPGAQDNERTNMTLKSLHEAIRSSSLLLTQQDNIRILDYGCGPVVCNIISAAGLPEVSEIVLAEYTERNRQAIQQWLDRDPSAFDWSPYFQYVTKSLEENEQEAIVREDKVRSLIKLAYCDITADTLIERGYEGPYDVVISLLCIEVSCLSIKEYHQRVAKILSLIKDGGVLMLMSTHGSHTGDQRFYCLESVKFSAITLTLDTIKDALTCAGLEIMQVVNLGGGCAKGDTANFTFITAIKKLYKSN